jgi:hypothetical protein
MGFFCWSIGCSAPVNNNEVISELPNEEKLSEYSPTDASDLQEKDTSEIIPENSSEINPEIHLETTPERPSERWIERKWTYRIIAGVSMGGAMSAIVGLRNHEKFDVIGTMGGPNDLTYLMYYIERSMLGGFCDLLSIEAAAKAGLLNTKTAYCSPPAPKPRFPYEFSSHFNDWHYDDAGGNWNRPKIADVLQDLVLAFGNPFHYNPNSTYWPHPSIPNNWRESNNRCDNPIRIKGFKHHLYNPEGKYDLITFCDGNKERSGVYYPDRPDEHTTPMEIVLAVDINGNGKRDYGEPVILMGHERFEDVGVDGCPNEREDGKGGCVPLGQKGADGPDPNGDDYHPIHNPKGTENNMIYDEGEPFHDYGLDGVTNTRDYGEGDGKFTVSPTRQNVYDHDPHTIIRKKMSRKQLDRLNIYIDGGIRDLFNFHITALNLMGAIKAHYPEQGRVQMYEQFISLMPPGSTYFDYVDVDWATKGQHVYVQYGNPNATKEELEQGDGDHVHGGKIIDRVFAFFSFASHQIPDPDLEPTPIDRSTLEGKVQHFTYDSKALKIKHLYSVVLPPGFFANPNKRYPVVYFGHGYGMSGPDMASLLLLLMPAMSQGHLAKMIMVSLHGRCEQWLPEADNPNKFQKKPMGHCHRGTFYVNGLGFNRDGLAMEDAVMEVVSEVETRYKNRIRTPDVRQYKIPAP